jgi:hypothetical protein
MIEIENNNAKCTDLNFLAHRTKANPKLMAEMISLYLKQTPALVAAMKQGLEDKDLPMLKAAIHTMIPSFSIMGISIDIENTAKSALEFISTGKGTEKLEGIVLQLEAVCTKACIELQEELNIIKIKS